MLTSRRWMYTPGSVTRMRLEGSLDDAGSDVLIRPEALLRCGGALPRM